MKKYSCIFYFSLATLCSVNSVFAQSDHSIPSLRKQGKATQLIVNGQPFMVLGGELGNSSASNLEYMHPIWKKLKLMNCNTVLTPVYWELIEPEKGRFDFILLDSIIESARKHEMKLVLLWFGSWKNSMSCYVPSWIKKDYKTFPRAYDEKGIAQEILTPFGAANLRADLNAFGALMKHVKEKDEKEQTVIMVQVENEIGMLPSARDYHPEATKAFNQDVPKRLMDYLQKNKSNLSPSALKAWEQNGFKTKGNWEQIFGKGLATDEIFIAWFFADFANKVAEEGKKIYPLPMFVNAALNRPNVKPGDYPSGGPLPHIIDIWKAATPSIDFLSPDFYNPDFKYWNDLYTREDNPLFIPEIRFEPSDAAKAFYAIGHYDAIGFSPFSIESTDKPEEEPIGKSYKVLSELSPLIYRHQGKRTMDGSLLDKKLSADTLRFDDYIFIVKHDYTLGWSSKAKEDSWPQTGGLVIQTAVDEFIVAGTGIVISFSSGQVDKGKVGILNIEEGEFINGKWISGRTMNGDQSHQGRHLRFEADDFGIQKLKLYQYK
jgi:beta-galactosidase GanA